MTLATRESGAQIMELVVAEGNLARLTPEQRLTYYVDVCNSIGVNPRTRPFEYIVLNEKLTLYARKDCTDQLRHSRKITVSIVDRSVVENVYVVTARATTADGQSDESIGAVPMLKEDGSWETASSGKRYFKKNGKLIPLTPDERANAIMKAETKAKRRVTLSICGLGFTDESELETIPGAKPAPTAESNGSSEPSISDLDTFVVEWDKLVIARGFGVEAGRSLLAAGCRQQDCALAETDSEWRLDKLQRLGSGEFDKALKNRSEASTRKPVPPTPAPSTEAQTQQSTDAAGGDDIDDNVLEPWTTFKSNFHLVAMDQGIDDKKADAVLRGLLAAAKIKDPAGTSLPWRRNILQAALDNRVDWALGRILESAPATV